MNRHHPGQPADRSTSLARLLQPPPERPVHGQSRLDAGPMPSTPARANPAPSAPKSLKPAPLHHARPERARQLDGSGNAGESEFQKNIKSYLRKADVQAHINAAKPVSSAPAKDRSGTDKISLPTVKTSGPRG